MVTLSNTFNSYPYTKPGNNKLATTCSLLLLGFFKLDNSSDFCSETTTSHEQPLGVMRTLGFGFSLLSRLISSYSYNVLNIWHPLIRGNGLSLNFEFRSANQVYSLLVAAGAECGSPVARYRPLLQRIPLRSPRQFVHRTLICDDRWGAQSVTINSSGLSYWSACCQLQQTSGSCAS